MRNTSTASGLRAADLAQQDWAHGRMSVETEGQDWQQFVSAWDDLALDSYLGNTRCRRNRRFGRLLAHRDGELEPLLGSEFLQTKDVNRVFGDQLRVFEPLTDAALSSPRFAQILGEDVAIINEVAGERDWELGVHFVRVHADAEEGSEPAPEGRHTDGHAYVAIHLIGRHQCIGGVSQVFRPDESEAQHTVTMTEPLETLMVCDTAVEHAVSEIRAENRSEAGRRDTMIVDFNPVRDLADVAGRTHKSLRSLQSLDAR